jgi:hypothetical protein
VSYTEGYDYRLDTGMKRADALPIVISIIEELMSETKSPSLHRWTTEQYKGKYFHSS